MKKKNFSNSPTFLFQFFLFHNFFHKSMQVQEIHKGTACSTSVHTEKSTETAQKTNRNCQRPNGTIQDQVQLPMTVNTRTSTTQPFQKFLLIDLRFQAW